MGAHDPTTGIAFCHIPKAAGWSVKAAMAEALPGLRVPDSPEYREWGNRVTVDPDIPKGHLALRDWREYVGTDPREYDMILAVRRNPYVREVSQFVYWRHLWGEGARMVQHAVASEYGWGVHRSRPEAFLGWLGDPRSAYHVHYDYHDHRPPKRIGGRYEDHGGFYRYWLGLDGEMPDNLKVLGASDLDEDLPDVLAPYTDEAVGVPRLNDGPDYEVAEFMSPEAADLIERRYEYAFERWYERASWREAA